MSLRRATETTLKKRAILIKIHTWPAHKHEMNSTVDAKKKHSKHTVATV